MIERTVYCSACGQPATHHITMIVTVLRPHEGQFNRRDKIIQFWLCDACERNSCTVLARDATQRERVARLITTRPERHYSDNTNYTPR